MSLRLPLYFFQLYGQEWPIRAMPAWHKLCGRDCSVAFPIYGLDSIETTHEYMNAPVDIDGVQRSIEQQRRFMANDVDLIPATWLQHFLWTANPEMPHDDAVLANWIEGSVEHGRFGLASPETWTAGRKYIDTCAAIGFRYMLIDCEHTIWAFAENLPCFQVDTWVNSMVLGFASLKNYASQRGVTLVLYHPWHWLSPVNTMPTYVSVANRILDALGHGGHLPYVLSSYPYIKGQIPVGHATMEQTARCHQVEHPRTIIGYLAESNATGRGWTPQEMKHHAQAERLWPNVSLFGDPRINVPLMLV